MLTFIANLIVLFTISTGVYENCFAPPQCDLPPECATLPNSTFNGQVAKEVQKQADQRKLGINVIRLACLNNKAGDVVCYVFTLKKTKVEDLTSTAAGMACEYRPKCPKEAELDRQKDEICQGVFLCPKIPGGEDEPNNEENIPI